MSTSESMVLTNLHLRAEQKRLMQARAKKHGTNLAEEVRTAVDLYLSGITPEEFVLLDEATKTTERLFAEMSTTLMATNKKAEQIFRMMEALKAKAGVQ